MARNRLSLHQSSGRRVWRPCFQPHYPRPEPKKIESALTDLWEEKNDEPIKLAKENGYTRVEMEEESEVQIGFNKKALIIAFSDFDPLEPNLLDKLFAQKKASKQPGLRPFLRSNDDVSAWINYKALENVATGLKVAVSGGNSDAVTLALNFEKGKIEGSATAYFADGSRKKMAGKGISSSLTKALPRDAVAYAAVSVDMKNYTDELFSNLEYVGLSKDMLDDQLRSMIGLSVSETQELLSGDVALAFDGIKLVKHTLDFDVISTTNKTPVPSFVIAADVADEDNCQKLFGTLEENGTLEMLNQSRIKLFERKGTMYCGIGDFMSNLKEKGKAEKTVNGKIKRLLKNHHAAVYIDLERAADLLKKFDLLDKDTRSLIQTFKSVELTGDINRKTEEAALSIEMRNKKQNSLKTIIEQALDLVD
ncbi:MAG: DUF4836 family protein [Pontiellaceae bacterium]|nr:DUF4836 family protein [Pontiellaceae bacterium]